MRFIFTKLQDTDNRFDTTEIVIKSDACGLDEILEDFKSFLLASGFIIDGDLDVVKDEVIPFNETND